MTEFESPFAAYDRAQALDAPIIAVLERYGPLRPEPLAYLVDRDQGREFYERFKSYVKTEDVLRAVELNESGSFTRYPDYRREGRSEDYCIRLCTQADMAPIMPSMWDGQYVGAYCDLFDMFQLIRQHPELATAPLGLLQDLLPQVRHVGVEPEVGQV